MVACRVVGRPELSDLGFVDAWYRKWFKGSTVEPPFGGRVHYVSHEVLEDGFAVDVDLGSAPVDALEELVAACVAHGATDVTVLSDERSLAGKYRPDDDQSYDMLELPDDLLDYLADVRSRYLRALQTHVESVTATSRADRVIIEAPIGPPGEGPLHRVDVAELQGGDFTPHDIVDRARVPWSARQFWIDHDVTVQVSPLAWHSVVVLASPVPADVTAIRAWSRQWFEHGFDVPPPFGGFVHSMSELEVHGGHLTFVVDLGSAPVEALRDLVEQCAAHGVTMMHFGSGDLALEGKHSPYDA